jgi:hypothetical protein
LTQIQLVSINEIVKAATNRGVFILDLGTQDLIIFTIAVFLNEVTIEFDYYLEITRWYLLSCFVGIPNLEDMVFGGVRYCNISS